MTQPRKRVLIFRSRMLPSSETFIRAQAAALRVYEPWFASLRKVEGLTVDPLPVVFPRGGRRRQLAAELAFRLAKRTQVLESQLKGLDSLLVHAHFGPDGVIALPLAMRMKLPLLTTLHGSDVAVDDATARRGTVAQRIYVRRRHDLIRHGSRFLAVSEFVARCAIEQGYPRERIVVHYIGIDTGFWTNRTRDAPEGSRVLFVGRLTEVKGCEHVITAVAELGRTRPDVELVIIGDGPLRAPLERHARAVRCRAAFRGVQTPEEVRIAMASAAVVCIPSVIAGDGAQEGLNLVALESQAMGVPVVAYSSGGVPEAVEHGRTGLLAAEGDTRTLATHLATVVDDGDMRRRMGRRGVARVSTQFDIATQTRTLETIYDEMTSNAAVSVGGTPGP